MLMMMMIIIITMMMMRMMMMMMTAMDMFFVDANGQFLLIDVYLTIFDFPKHKKEVALKQVFYDKES
jgi:hypothetical protein